MTVVMSADDLSSTSCLIFVDLFLYLCCCNILFRGVSEVRSVPVFCFVIAAAPIMLC